jgi:rhodanese-related sulfurtransferase
MNRLLMLAGALVVGCSGSAHAQTPPAKAAMAKICGSCHKPAANTVRGYFDNVAFKSQSIQLALDADKAILRFDPKVVKVIDGDDAKQTEHMREVRKGHETLLTYVERDGQRWVTEVHFKGPVKVAKEDLVDYAFVKNVADGKVPNAVLIDSRPLPRFQQGTIPGSINVPYPVWDKVVNRLPADKSTTLVFFCQGVTCQMSPLSQRKARGLGYKSTKVYHEGVPEWEMRNYLATAPAFVKEAYVDKDIPAIILDVRRPDESAASHLKGAVNIPLAALPAQLKTFPPAKLKAPIIVYDGRGGDDAVAAARALIKAGQTNVQVLERGLLGWQRAGLAVESGTPALTKVAYTPKPRPGAIAMAEFSTLARKTPADVLILDVRNQDEANSGMITGAVLIPDEELAARIGELPKDKRIIAHCSTGIRAEMAYYKLKEAGYKAGFLNAEIDVAKNGSFTITSK